MSFTPIVAEFDLDPVEYRGGQLGASESRLIATKSFRKCHVSATLSDLQPCYLVGRDGSKRECCVVFLQFNFGAQKQGSDQRVTSMTIEINIEEGTEVEISKSPTSTQDAELEIKGRYPISASGPVEEKIVSTSGAISLSPQVNGTAIGSVTAQRGTQYKIPKATSLFSSPAGLLGARWQLEENEIHKGGIPGLVNIALALQTDGLPFEIEMLFSGQCPLLGAFRVKGKAVMRIGRDLLWMRSSRKDFVVDGREDIDSATFRDWVKTKTRNSWAEKIEYED